MNAPVMPKPRCTRSSRRSSTRPNRTSTSTTLCYIGCAANCESRPAATLSHWVPRALHVARAQGARLFALDALVSLHTLSLRQGQPSPHRDALDALTQELSSTCADSVSVQRAKSLLHGDWRGALTATARYLPKDDQAQSGAAEH
jgi:hypothetical protein